MVVVVVVVVVVVDALGEGEKRRRGRGEEEKAQSEKREAVAAFRGREADRERIIAASGRPGLRSRALIGCFEEDETSGRTARAVFPFLVRRRESSVRAVTSNPHVYSHWVCRYQQMILSRVCSLARSSWVFFCCELTGLIDR